MAPMIEVHELQRTFKSRKSTVEAVRGVDLVVEAGEIFGFLGPNGASKTTTLRMPATLIRPSGGTALVASADLLREPGLVRQRIGYVSQGGSSFELETGRRELVLKGRLYSMTRLEAERRASELLATLDLQAAADRKTGTHSGGMRRRLEHRTRHDAPAAPAVPRRARRGTGRCRAQRDGGGRPITDAGALPPPRVA